MASTELLPPVGATHGGDDEAHARQLQQVRHLRSLRDDVLDAFLVTYAQR